MLIQLGSRNTTARTARPQLAPPAPDIKLRSSTSRLEENLLRCRPESARTLAASLGTKAMTLLCNTKTSHIGLAVAALID